MRCVDEVFFVYHFRGFIRDGAGHRIFFFSPEELGSLFRRDLDFIIKQSQQGGFNVAKLEKVLVLECVCRSSIADAVRERPTTVLGSALSLRTRTNTTPPSTV